MAKSFSRLSQEEVDLFCMEWGIGTKYRPVAPACDKSINECPSGMIALYCRHFEFSNLRCPFSNFVLNILEYYRVSFGQIHPLGMARVLHFEILCRATGYDPSLLSFRRFFRLAKNGDWFTFETSQVDTCLISSMVSTLGVWKDRFFWVSEEIVPFKLVWRHPDAVLNEQDPVAFDINTRFLETLRECPSRLRPFPEHLLVLLGISKLWEKANQDPVLIRDGQVMSALDFIKSDDTSDVGFDDVAATPGENVVVKGSDYRFEGSGYVNVPNVKGFTKATASKGSTRRSQCHLKGVEQPSGSEPIDVSDDIEVSTDQAMDVDKGKEKELIVSSKKKKLIKKGATPAIQGSSVKSVESFEGSRGQTFMCPTGGLRLVIILKIPLFVLKLLLILLLPTMMLSSCNLSAFLAEGVTRFAKGMQEYEEASKKKDKMKASIAAMKKEIACFAEKEEAWSKKVDDLSKQHEIEMSDFKKSFEADREKLKANREALFVQQRAFDAEKEGFKAVVARTTSDNQWLIEQGFQQGLIAGYNLHESGQPLEKSPLFRPEASNVFKGSVEQMERLTYPYIHQVSACFGKPLTVLQDLKPEGLNEKVCSEVLDSVSRKRSYSGDSDDTPSGEPDASKDASLEGSAVGGDDGAKAKKLKKAKKAKGEGPGVSKPSADA
ncbi:hypothetical protein HanIR_Chr03g0124961 [Helianthus annuus]|nr:hypothetical protein HanIR_Chr03g0124961 [Helianthus annuus]